MAQGKPLTEHERAKVIAYYRHGYGLRSTAKILGFSLCAVRDVVRSAGLSRSQDDGYSLWRKGV